MCAANAFAAFGDRGGVVAGFDGSDHAREATRWAAAEAASRSCPLLLVHAHLPAVTNTWGTLAAPGSGGAALFDDTQTVRQVKQHLDAVAEECRSREPGLDVGTVVGTGRASPALVDAADAVDAELLVVGMSGIGALPRALLGSTAADLVHHVARPVVVVRDTPVGGNPLVVVGVDGTNASMPAVRFAFDFAARRGCGLRTVHALSDSPLDALRVAGLWERGHDDRAAVDLVRDEFLGAWRQRHPDVSVEVDVVEDRPAHALLDRSERAQLLVVGNRGRGPVRRTLFGSVSHAALYHASCPVAVVPGGGEIHSAVDEATPSAP